MKNLIKKGMGFKAAQDSISKKQGIPKKNAAAILAAGARKASPAAKSANPNLKKVSKPSQPKVTVNMPNKIKPVDRSKLMGPGVAPMPTKHQRENAIKKLSSKKAK